MNNIKALRELEKMQENGIQISEKEIVIYDSKLTSLEPWQQIALKSEAGHDRWVKKNQLRAEAFQKAKAWDSVYNYIKQTDEYLNEAHKLNTKEFNYCAALQVRNIKTLMEMSIPAHQAK